MPKERYRVVEHTADIGIEAFGLTLLELFANAAWGLTDTLTDAAAVRECESREIQVSAQDRSELLIAWLSELLYLFDTERKLFCRSEILNLTTNALHARVHGETFDPVRHAIRHDVKAVTYHGIEIQGRPGSWKATVIFDI